MHEDEELHSVTVLKSSVNVLQVDFPRVASFSQALIEVILSLKSNTNSSQFDNRGQVAAVLARQ